MMEQSQRPVRAAALGAAREDRDRGAARLCRARAAVALGVYALTSGAPARADCIDVTFASTLGGAELHACGAQARAICASGALQRHRERSCARPARRAGFAVRPASRALAAAARVPHRAAALRAARRLDKCRNARPKCWPGWPYPPSAAAGFHTRTVNRRARLACVNWAASRHIHNVGNGGTCPGCAYPSWLNPGDNAWQMTAATFVGLMSLPGPRGPVRRRHAEALVGQQHDAHVRRVLRSCWSPGCCGRSRWASAPRSGADTGSSTPFWGKSGTVLGHGAEQGQAVIPSITDRAAVPLPAVLARLLPVRVRGDHADPDARLGARADQLQGLDPVRAAVDHVRVHDQRVPDLGRRLLRRPRRAGLLRWLRDPPRGRHLGLRGGGGDRTDACNEIARSTRRTTC